MQLKICYLVMVALAILVHVTLALPLHPLDSKLQPPDSKMAAYGKLKELQMQIERDLQDINKRVEALPLAQDDLDKMILKDAMLDVKTVLRRMIRKAQVDLDASVLPSHQHVSHPWSRNPSFDSSTTPTMLRKRGRMDCWKSSFETVKNLFKKDEKRKHYTKIPPPIPGPRPVVTHEDVKKDPEPPPRPPRKYPWLPWYTPNDLGRPRPGRPRNRPTPPPPFYFNRNGQSRVERPGEPREW